MPRSGRCPSTSEAFDRSGTLNRVSVLLPPDVLRAATGTSVVEHVSERPIRGSSGAATGEVFRLVGAVTIQGESRPFSLIRKTVRPLTSGLHAEASKSPDHWAYWRREPLAYEAKVPPAGPGLRAPRCFGVHLDTVYLEDVTGPPQDPDRAAHHLGRWQVTAKPPSVPWLCGHQLEQRIAVTDLDWSGTEGDRRAVDIWEARNALLDELGRAPRVLSHGDYSLGNLISDGDDTVAIDWGTVGIAPAGADLAHLALSSLTDPLPAYLAASRNGPPADDVLLGYQTTMALTGASRLHWMLNSQADVPHHYVDFLWAHRPPLLRAMTL
jgi:hypothetical protein